MKEYIETITSSFVDYEGKIHNFVIAAISQTLPNNADQFNVKGLEKNSPVYFEVSSYIEDYGTLDYHGTVTKALYLGVSICNPVDEFNEEKGKQKAIARARATSPAMWVRNPGLINTKMVKALLEQEAKYIIDNPNIVIKGYSEKEAKYLYNKEMQKQGETLNDAEKSIISKALTNNKYLDKLSKYVSWLKNNDK